MTSSATEQQERSGLTPRSIVFWRNIAGILLILLVQHPRLYSGYGMFAGVWLGTAAVAFGTAVLATGLGYFFFTGYLREKARVWWVFISVAWVVAAVQLMGEWVLPSVVVERIGAVDPIAAQSNVPARQPVATTRVLEKIDATPYEALCREQLAKRYPHDDFFLIRPHPDDLSYDLKVGALYGRCLIVGPGSDCIQGSLSDDGQYHIVYAVGLGASIHVPEERETASCFAGPGKRTKVVKIEDLKKTLEFQDQHDKARVVKK